MIEHESFENHMDSINYPLELTMKGLQQSNRILSSSSPDIHNLVVCLSSKLFKTIEFRLENS